MFGQQDARPDGFQTVPMPKGARDSADTHRREIQHTPGSLSTARHTVTAQATLRHALASIDETTLAQHLRVSVPTLRRYLGGTLRMNWVIVTRLAALPEQVVAPKNAYRSTTTVRHERRPARRTPMATQVVVGV